MKKITANQSGFSKLVLIATVAIIAIVGITLALTLGDRNKPLLDEGSTDYRSVSDQFMFLIAEQDAAPSYELMSVRLKAEFLGVEEWQERLTSSFGNKKVNYALTHATQIENHEFTYFEYEKPFSMTYSVSVDDDKYLMHVVVVQTQSGGFLVDEFNSITQESS